MTQALLVGTDCSECSHRALDHAARWAKEAGLHLFVVYVIQWSPFSFNTVQENAERHKRREEELERAHSRIIDPINSMLHIYHSCLMCTNVIIIRDDNYFL